MGTCSPGYEISTVESAETSGGRTGWLGRRYITAVTIGASCESRISRQERDNIESTGGYIKKGQQERDEEKERSRMDRRMADDRDPCGSAFYCSSSDSATIKTVIKYMWLDLNLRFRLDLRQRGHHPHHLALVLRMLPQPTKSLASAGRCEVGVRTIASLTHFANIDVSFHRGGGSRFPIDQ